MNIEIVQKYNKEYILECYDELLKHRTKFRKYQKIVGIFFIFLGIILYFQTDLLFDCLFSFFLGLFMIGDFYYTKHKWIKSRLNSKQNNFETKLFFNDEEMRSVTKFGTSSLKWEFFSDAIKTEKGLTLVLENETSIYIQKSLLEEKYMDEIIKNIKNQP